MQSESIRQLFGKCRTLKCHCPDVVFYKNRNTVEGTAWTVKKALIIQRSGLVKCGGVCLDYSTKGSALEIHFLDASEICLFEFINNAVNLERSFECYALIRSTLLNWPEVSPA